MQSSVMSYAELAEQADRFCEELSRKLATAVSRPLILLEAVNEPESIIDYLGALRARWPVILVAEGAADDTSPIVEAYKPNVFLRKAEGWHLRNVLRPDNHSR
jgi:hypothetical protein